MKGFFSYSDGHNFGSNAYFCTIPFFLHLHKHQFGLDIADLDVDVVLRPRVKVDEQFSSENEGRSRAPELNPKFKIFKTTRKLKISYNSRYFFMRQTVGSERAVECQRFKDHYDEFREVARQLGPEIAKQSDFDNSAFLDLIDQMAEKLPQRDEELILLEEGLSQYRKKYSNSEFAADPYRSTTIPEVIRISRFRDEMGEYDSGNQFLAGVYGPFKIPAAAGEVNSIEKATQSYYAVLHKFKLSGEYIETDYKCVFSNAQNSREAIAEAHGLLASMLESLPLVRNTDITIELFQMEIDGNKFGLIDSSSEEDGDSVTLVPNDWYFKEPWDGCYQT